MNHGCRAMPRSDTRRRQYLYLVYTTSNYAENSSYGPYTTICSFAFLVITFGKKSIGWHPNSDPQDKQKNKGPNVLFFALHKSSNSIWAKYSNKKLRFKQNGEYLQN